MGGSHGKNVISQEQERAAANANMARGMSWRGVDFVAVDYLLTVVDFYQIVVAGMNIQLTEVS